MSGLYKQFSEPVALGGDKKNPWEDKKKLESNVSFYRKFYFSINITEIPVNL